MTKINTLIIDTSKAGIDLLINNTHKHIDAEKQAVALPAETENFLKEQGLDWKDISAIGVVVGPGSFTGIRLGIAYAKGLSIGLKIPVIPINAFEIYLEKTPDAFVAIDSGRGDLFVSSPDLEPCTMTIEEVETEQMKCPITVGHKPYELLDALSVTLRKFESGKTEPVVPMYLRPSYAEINQCSTN